MNSVTHAERRLYEDVWSSISNYGEFSPGERYLPVFLAIAGDMRGSVLDAGAGSGKGAVALARVGFDVTLCDLTREGLVADAEPFPFLPGCLWSDLSARGRYDYVYCTDVLEHVPPQFTMLVVHRMLSVARRGLFISVSLVPDAFGVWAGRSLHQTVQPFTWWRDNLHELGDVVDARDLLNTALFYVRPSR